MLEELTCVQVFPEFAFFSFFNPIMETAAALCKDRGGGRSSERGIRTSAAFELEFGIKII